MALVIGNTEVQASGWRFARALEAAGVGTRGVVAALLGNTPEFLAVWRGSTWSGRRLTSMSWRWTPDEVDYVVGNCEADAFVADVRFAEAARAAAGRVPAECRFAVGGEIPGFRPWSEVEALSGEEIAEPLAGDTMLYTSGTTGRPKGVQRASLPEGPPPGIVGRAGMAMIQAFMQGERHEGAHLVCAPLYHSGPSTYCEGALLLGADVVLMERFDPEQVLAAIERHRVMSVFMVPTHFVRLLRLPEDVRRRHDLSSLRLVLHGAAPVSVEVKRAMIDWLGPILFEFYGGTEGGGCMIDAEDWLAHPGSVGRPRPGVCVRVLDDEGKECPPGREGAVCFDLEDSPFVYKDDPEKTAAGRRGDYFTLGDIGYLDEDGYLYLCDRAADTIISGGVNVYPAQIESVLLELPFVADCCVVGAPNEEWGEEVRAVVEPVAEETRSPEALAEAVLGHCRERLAGYQVPRAVDLDRGLPRTEAGKLARRLVRDRYWQGRERRV